MKMMYVNSDAMQIMNGVGAMDKTLAQPVLRQPKQGKTTDQFDVAFDQVIFSYDEATETEALSGVTFSVILFYKILK